MGVIVFVVAGQIGGTNAWDADEPQEPLLDAERIVALQAEGVVFGSHTMAHQPLARIGRDRAWGELTRSRCDACNRCVAEMDRPAGVRCVRGS
jgi:hypothetical protein